MDLDLFSEDQEGPIFDHVSVPRARKVMHKIMLGLHGDVGGEQTFAFEKSFMIFVCPAIREQVRGVPEVTLRRLLTREELVGLLAVDVAVAGSRQVLEGGEVGGRVCRGFSMLVVRIGARLGGGWTPFWRRKWHCRPWGF